LMKVIDEVKPALLYSLHNAGFGGVYYYVSRPCEPLYDTFQQIPQWFDLALDLGEPEVPYAPRFAPAVYGMLSARDTYDHLEQNGIADPAATIKSGASSAEYAQKYGSFFLVVEMPYFDDPRVNDQSISATSRREAIVQNMDRQDEFDAWTEQQLEAIRADLKLETPLSRAVHAFLGMGKAYRQAQRQWALSSEETLRPATEAELFSNRLGSRFYRLLILGMFARILNDEVAQGNTSRAIASTRDAARTRLDAQSVELEGQLKYRALPIRSLVGVQTCVGLATAAYIANGAA
jgi:hypothetical protein